MAHYKYVGGNPILLFYDYSNTVKKYVCLIVLGI